MIFVSGLQWRLVLVFVAEAGYELDVFGFVEPVLAGNGDFVGVGDEKAGTPVAGVGSAGPTA